MNSHEGGHCPVRNDQKVMCEAPVNPLATNNKFSMRLNDLGLSLSFRLCDEHSVVFRVGQVQHGQG